MYIVDVPIEQFYQECLISARKHNFSFLMCFVARDADARNEYDELKNNWHSLHDLTGDHILFTIAGMNVNQNRNSYISISGSCGEGIASENFSIINNTDLDTERRTERRRSISGCFPADEVDFDDLRRSQTLSTSSLKNTFGIKEKDVPCLVLVDIGTESRDCHSFVIPLKNGNSIYDFTKYFISYYEDLLKENEEKISSDEKQMLALQYRKESIQNEILHLKTKRKKVNEIQCRIEETMKALGKCTKYLERIASPKSLFDRHTKEIVEAVLNDPNQIDRIDLNAIHEKAKRGLKNFRILRERKAIYDETVNEVQRNPDTAKELSKTIEKLAKEMEIFQESLLTIGERIIQKKKIMRETMRENIRNYLRIKQNEIIPVKNKSTTPAHISFTGSNNTIIIGNSNTVYPYDINSLLSALENKLTQDQKTELENAIKADGIRAKQEGLGENFKTFIGSFANNILANAITVLVQKYYGF